MGEIRDNVKKNLGYYLSLKGISQKELADKLSVSQSAVTNWIKGKNSPDIEVVAQICDILEISVTDLFGSDNAKVDPCAEREKKQREFFDVFDELSPALQDYLIKTAKDLLEIQSKMQTPDEQK